MFGIARVNVCCGRSNIKAAMSDRGIFHRDNGWEVSSGCLASVTPKCYIN